VTIASKSDQERSQLIDGGQVAEALGVCGVSQVLCFDTTIRFLTAPTLFLPDEWTQALLTGVSRRFGFGNDLGVVAEIGVGPGTIPLSLSFGMRHSMKAYVGVDINPVSCQIARLNLLLACPNLPSSIRLADVCNPAEELWEGDVDVLVANLPQMPAPNPGGLDPNNYYPLHSIDLGDRVPLSLGMCGLSLVAHALRIASSRLRPSGVALITVSERCGTEQLDEIFRCTNLKWQSLYTVRVPQASDTTIEPLVHAELTNGVQCRFFAGMDERVPISANQAAARLKQGSQVFHDLHVVLAQKT
jgi:methylase of polypeptide subunit release factors